MRFVLIDVDAGVVASLRGAFAHFPEVAVASGDLLVVAHNAVVSPANGQGFMDGGIDAAYAVAIPDVERRVRDAIARRPEGYLPIGAAVIVPVTHDRIDYVIAATTMVGPEAVEADHAYRALRAALRVASAHTQRIHSLYCPGLCTGVGLVPAPLAARSMASAYADWKAATEKSVSPA